MSKDSWQNLRFNATKLEESPKVHASFAIQRHGSWDNPSLMEKNTFVTFHEIPATPNKHVLMDVWLNNHFASKDLESSNLNNCSGCFRFQALIILWHMNFLPSFNSRFLYFSCELFFFNSDYSKWWWNSTTSPMIIKNQLNASNCPF